MTAVQSFPPHDPYTSERALGYEQHHGSSLRRRLTSWREQRCLAAALRLAGSPDRVLDVPCGAGRFWRTFGEEGVSELVAMDLSAGMMERASMLFSIGSLQGNPSGILIRGDIFRIPLEADAVDFVACMRFIHHLSMPEYRRSVLDELVRVSRRFVAVSLWVDGNYSSSRRLAKKSSEDVRPGYGGRHCFPRNLIEAEFAAAGLRVVHHYDIWPKLGMWRLYLLEQS